jgi:ornithine cyclodeaminase/alanine dehydrogenase-like protein (mu-crystallin family)
MQERLALEVRCAKSPTEAVSDADIVCTATTSTSPVFADRDLKSGVHINAVGSYQPHVCEMPPETVRRARVIVDHRESALAETGDLIQPIQSGLIEESHICGELGEVLYGAVGGRTAPEEITLFKSVGVAVQDLVAAARALAQAEERGLGTQVAL